VVRVPAHGDGVFARDEGAAAVGPVRTGLVDPGVVPPP
jgi:hypothetical protein